MGINQRASAAREGWRSVMVAFGCGFIYKRWVGVRQEMDGSMMASDHSLLFGGFYGKWKPRSAVA